MSDTSNTPLISTPPEVELPTVPVSPSNAGDTNLAGQLAEATRRIAELESERAHEAAEHERVVEEQKLKVAASIAKQPSPKIGTAEQDIKFDKAVRAVGGRAFFANKLTPAQQAELTGVQVGDTSLDTVKQYFGPGSDSKKANELGMINPAEYKRLRGIAKLRGLI